MKKKFLAKSVFWLTLSEIIFNLSGYIIHSGVGRILGPAGYGQYGLVITLTTMIIVLIGNGVPTAMSKYLSEFFEKQPKKINLIKKQTAFLQLIIIGFITLIFYLSAPLLAKALNDSRLSSLFRISSLIIPAFAAASFYFYYFTGIHQFKLQAFIKTLRSIFKVIFILTLAWYWKVKGAIVGYIFAPLSVFIIASFIDYFWIRPKIYKQKATLSLINKNATNSQNFSYNNFYKLLFNYAWPFTLFTLFYEIMISIDLYMVKGVLHNDVATGIYNGALTVGRIPYYLFYALAIILLPVISRSTSYSKNLNQETKKIIQSTLRLLIIFLIPAIILMFSYSMPIIKIFYGEKYISAAPLMAWLVWGVGFLTFFYVISFIFNGAGKVKIPMWLAFIGAILNTFLSYFFIPIWKLKGAVLATDITSLLVAIGILFCLSHFFKTHLPYTTLLRSLMAGLFIFILSFMLPHGILGFIFSSLILISLYFFLLYITKEISQEDFLLFHNLPLRKNKN